MNNKPLIRLTLVTVLVTQATCAIAQAITEPRVTVKATIIDTMGNPIEGATVEAGFSGFTKDRIKPPIQLSARGKITFAYYFNPDVNDRNLEFDPGQNLLKIPDSDVPVRLP